MTTLTKCFGIISWLPDKGTARQARQERLNRLLKQLEELWPNIDILIIAQNWQGFEPIKIINKVIIKEYPELGILGARKTLREEFLALDYNYIIMFDDDAIIETSDNAHIKYMQLLDKFPNGFCFIHGHNSRYHPYCAAQLNLCAISRFIYEKEPMVEIDPQKNEGFEDSIYACLLHHKYRQYEFDPPANIKCTQFNNRTEHVPSTWVATERRPMQTMIKNTNNIQQYIVDNKDFPANYKAFFEPEFKPIEKQADGKKGAYLYF